MLTEAQRTLQKAVDKPPALIEFFLKHTVTPRLEWLEDLGYLCSERDGTLLISRKGTTILQQIRRMGGWHQTFILLPLDHWLASHLDIPNFYPGESSNDFSWRIAAAANGPCDIVIPDHASLLMEIKALYPFVKLANFNEADALSIYEVIATKNATQGSVLSQVDFEKVLIDLVQQFPREIFKLSKRRGKGLYIGLKTPA
jgi:hypothetical protein